MRKTKSKKGGSSSGRRGFSSRSKSGSSATSREDLTKSISQRIKDMTKPKSREEIIEDAKQEKMMASMAASAAKKGAKGSKNYLMAMELVKKSMEKKKRKKIKSGIEITPKPVMGIVSGRVTADGKVISDSGKIVLTIDPQTGVIKNHKGLKVGKYKAGSANNDYALSRLLEKHGQD